MNIELRLNIKDGEVKVLNKIIKNLAGFVQYKNDSISTPVRQHNEYQDLLFNFLFDKSNLEKLLKKLKVSHGSITSLNMLMLLKDVKDENSTEKMCFYINKRLKELEKEKMEVYSFYFFLNIRKFRHIDEPFEGKLEKFEEILKIFDIKRVVYKQVKEDMYELKNLVFSSNGETILVEVEARDFLYAYNEAKFKVEIFLGFLEFVQSQFRTSSRHPAFERGNYKINILTSGLFLIFVDQNLIEPYDYNEFQDSEYSLIDHINKNINFLDTVELKHLDIILNNCNLIKEIENEKLIETFSNAFSLYYLALSEKTLDNSFLKFWALSEMIIKSSGGKNEDDLKGIMIKFLKNKVELFINEFLEERIEFLFDCRNKLVHEGKIKKVTVEDRDLSKILADSVLRVFLDHRPRSLGDFHEFINKI